MFKQTLQQNKWYKEEVYIKCKKQGHYAKDCIQGQGTNAVKGTSILQSESKIKSIKEYIIKSFIFYYNNYCLVY